MFNVSLPITSPVTGRVDIDVLFNGRNWNIFVTYLKHKKLQDINLLVRIKKIEILKFNFVMSIVNRRFRINNIMQN